MQRFLQKVGDAVYPASKRTFLLLSCALLIFSVSQVSILLYLQDKAAAQTTRDPLSALAQGRTPQPLPSAQSPKTKALDTVSPEVRAQANTTNVRPSKPQAGDWQGASENTSERTENSRTFSLKNGTKVQEYYGHDVAYKDNGTMRSISPSLSTDQTYVDHAKQQRSLLQKLKFWDQPRAFNGSGGPLKAGFQPLQKGSGVTVQLNGQRIAMQPVGSSGNVQPKQLNNDDGTKAISYPDVWDGVDLVYEYRGDTVKEMIVLRKPTRQTAFDFTVTGEKVQLKHGKNGSVDVWQNGKPVFTIPALTVMATERGPVSNSGAKYVIHGNHLSVSLSASWLSRQTTKNFPITIDPTVSVHESWEGVSNNGADYWSYKSDGYQCPSSSCYQNIGWLTDNGTKKWQTMMRIPFDQAIG